MKKEEYKQIENTWEILLKQTKKRYDKLQTTELLDFKVCELKELITYSKQFLLKMEDLFCDFRHIVGMAELKDDQLNRLTYLFKEITSYRPEAKRISQISTLDLSTDIVSNCKYQLKITPEITLISSPKTNKINKDKKVEIKNKIEIKQIRDDIIQILFTENLLLDFRVLYNKATNQRINFEKYNLEKFKRKLDNNNFSGLNIIKDGNKYIITIEEENKETQVMYRYLKENVNS